MSNYYVSAKKDCFGHYLTRIGKYAILTKEEEYTYGVYIQKMISYLAHLKEDGCSREEAARRCGVPLAEYEEVIRTGTYYKNKMFNHNLRLVVYIARKYNNRGVDIEDLVQEGNLGLARAVEKFNPELGYKFSTYSTWWIRQSIIRAVANQSRIIRLPVHIYDLLNRIKKAERTLTQEHGRQIRATEIVDKLNIRMDKLQSLRYQSKKVWSLDSDRYNSEDSPSLTECYRNTEQEEDNLFMQEMESKAQMLLDMLTEQEREIITKRFGIGETVPMSYKAIAEEMELSSQFVRNTSFRVFKKLKSLCDEQDIAFYESELVNY